MNIDFVLTSQFDFIIEKVTEAGAEAVIIAGGAVRDMVMNKPIADIDVFYVGELNHETLQKHFKFHVNPNKDKHDFYKEKKAFWKVSDILLKMEDCEYPIQLINVKRDKRKTYHPAMTLTDHVTKFGCNLSMMLYNAGGLFVFREAMQDMFIEQLTFNKHCSNNSYIRKVYAKYPEFSLDTTECSEWLTDNGILGQAAFQWQPEPAQIQMEEVLLDNEF